MAMTRRNSVLLSTFVSGQKMTVKSLSVPSFHVFADPLEGKSGASSRGNSSSNSSAFGEHRSACLFCRRYAPGLNWPGCASGAVTLKKLERTTAKAFTKDVFINQERKLGARRRSDTVLVSTINDADQGSAYVAFRTPLAPYEKSKSLGSVGSMVARLKLKGIDGRAPPGVEPAA
ncbi:hypothetical protein YC2023_082748 [Brassica napus]